MSSSDGALAHPGRETIKENRDALEQHVEEDGRGAWAVEAVLQSLDAEASDP